MKQPHIKENEELPDVNKMETGNLIEKEFRVIVIWMLKWLDKMFRNQAEVKNDIAEIRNTMEDFTERR